MTIRFQRLIIILLSLTLISGAVILILINSKNNIVFFYTPSEVTKLNIDKNQIIRIGGIVKKNSIQKKLNGTSVRFIITDNQKDIFVEYKGILPDLFREKQGAVVEGILINDNEIKAERVLAKHDANYMPASIKKQLEEIDYWQKDY